MMHCFITIAPYPHPMCLILTITLTRQEDLKQQKDKSDGLTYGGGVGSDKPSKEGVERMAKVCSKQAITASMIFSNHM